MKEAIKGKHLVERFNRFVEYNKSSRKEKKEVFARQLDERVQPEEEKTGSKKEEQPQRRSSEVRGARRNQPPPRLAKAKTISNLQARRLANLAPIIEDAARRHKVPVELICGVILQESGGNHKAVSSCGARGLMQLMPGTAKRFGVTDSFDPKQNIEGGTKYLRFLLDRFHGNIELALAGYNAGEGNVAKYGNKVPPFAETKAYIPNVLGYTQSMIDVFSAKLAGELPEYARKV